MILFFLITFTILSCSISLVMVWYIRELIEKFNIAISNSNQVIVSIDEYKTHLNSVYELESYFGDPTIGGLLQHTSDLLKEVEDYQDLFYTPVNKEINEGQ